jgi:hypothetical protein
MQYGCPLKYNGFAILVDLIEVASRYDGDAKNNLKSIYMEVGDKYYMSRLCVERNLRTLVDAWRVSDKFGELFAQIPTNAELVMMLVNKFIDIDIDAAKSHSGIWNCVYDILY